MKRILALVGLAAVFAAAFWWFSRSDAPKPEPTAAPIANVSVDEAKHREREVLFGAEALKPGIEWRESGLGYKIIAEGGAAKPGIGTPVKLVYVGRLKDGKVFDQSDTPSEFLVGATIPGLSVGLQMLGVGGKAVFFIPPSLGYGNHKVMGIPPNSGLIFEVQVASISQ
jgi:FKBP-type peptidyl-prolyl cis-trans isomerase